MLAILIFRLSRLNQILRIASGAFVVLKSVELVMFFINNNKSYPAYVFLYSFIALIVVILGMSKSGNRHGQFG